MDKNETNVNSGGYGKEKKLLEGDSPERLCPPVAFIPEIIIRGHINLYNERRYLLQGVLTLKERPIYVT